MYLSFQTIHNMSGAGWDESSMLVPLSLAMWATLALEKNQWETGKDLSQWQNWLFSFLHDLMALVKVKVATGELVKSTEDDDNIRTNVQDVGKIFPLYS
jgi:hypothetical protein